ncbi:hypothetical protein DFP72DRAFT_1070003 [Ephemerocybe angulata]|uniref:Uncharacterized protein n=1 Tax=Ephemerocybe angulata TaxID=980116 RepID=A0A8H6HUF7_9AGAR|nr:hypothetical protein DFP72DRAFT_1070003 [Tulosesus angulatus]
MPKSAPLTPTKRRAAKETSETPTPKKARKSPKKAPVVVDESTWRTSSISSGTTINKVAINEQYRIKDPAALGLKPCRQEVVTKVIKGRETDVTMILYNEREVERAAWRKHGGPDGFHAYLKKLHESQKKNKPEGTFHAPSSYFSNSLPYVGIMTLPAASGSSDIFANTPELRNLKIRMINKAHGDEWLWKACNLYLWGNVTGNNAHERCILTAVTQLPAYPPRTPPPAVLSPEFQALKALMEEAPTRGDMCMGVSVPPKNTHNIRGDDIPFPQDCREYWSTGYLTRIYQALINIIGTHGVGDEGWKAARWMVYDEYLNWDGIRLSLTEATDNAFGWLQSRLPPGTNPQLEFSVFDVHNHPPPIWAQYNALLPTSA